MSHDFAHWSQTRRRSVAVRPTRPEAWERRSKPADGREAVAHGQYMTVWAKQKDGRWKAVFDAGGEDPRKR
ncbi:MAG TPA: hypothetical protein VGH34_14985 [Vicinamibacterales bacterium]|jgi:hypothetical protein